MVIHQDQVTILHLTTGHHGSVTDDSDRAASLSGARSYLRDADPVLARLIDDRPDVRRQAERRCPEPPAFDRAGLPELVIPGPGVADGINTCF
jgi:hypothetical protein